MLVLISPAKTLDFETPAHVALNSDAAFLDHSQELIDTLRRLSSAEISGLMSLSDKLTQLNHERFHAWQPPFHPGNAKPAVLAFRGDVYTGLDADSLSEADFEFAQQHLRILSGLYGVLKPMDLIQAYRLEMGTKLQNPRGKDLYTFWGDLLTEHLNAELTSQSDASVINLASNEYFKAVKKKQLSGQLITPVFKDWKNGQYKMISFFAKKARGMMARYIIDHQITSAEPLKQFDTAGYAFSEENSSDNEWVFLRKEA